jgi:hypothetical protein
MNEIQQKSILAKLLATEDITVIHDAKASTAAFDVKNRDLYLPVFKKMSNDLYDLFVGHEVGHAHYTPEEGWHDAVCDNPSLKGFYNIIEDARIERKIKKLYPGLASSFYKGYKELFDRDFFGIRGRDVNTFPFADRINIHFKLGHMAGVQFTETEQTFIDRISNTETWDDVKTLAHELADISREEAKNKEDEGSDIKQQIQDLLDKMEGLKGDQPNKPESSEMDEWDTRWDIEREDREKHEDEDGEVPEDYEFDRYSDEVTKEVQERVKEATERNDKFEELQEQIDEAQKEIDTLKEDLKYHEEEGQHSQTDATFRQMEATLLDKDPTDVMYVNMDLDVDVKDVIVPMDELYNWEESVEYEVTGKELTNEEIREKGKKLAKDYVQANQPVINQMAQQFELRKAATGFKKARISKTGKLNEDKLWAYKLTEDLFQQTQVVPNGKNHGLLMYVDLSGSMYRHIAGTIEQAINMAMFCRKVGIPFDVYGFSDCTSREHSVPKTKKDYAKGDFVFSNSRFSLVHMLSSTCKKTTWDNALAYLQIMIKGYGSRYRNYYDDDYEYVYLRNRFFSLGGTPLNNALAFAPAVAKKFMKKYNVEVLSTIFLTDGGATDDLRFFERTVEDGDGTRNQTKVPYSEMLVARVGASTIQAPQKGGNYYYRNEATTAFLLEFYKKVTGSRLFNFHIVDPKKHAFENEFTKRSTDRSWDGFNNWYKDVLRNKFGVIVEAHGYDTSLIVRGSKDLRIEDEELEVKSNKRGDLLRGFRNFNKNKKTSRTFVNQIIELVA